MVKTLKTMIITLKSGEDIHIWDTPDNVFVFGVLDQFHNHETLVFPYLDGIAKIPFHAIEKIVVVDETEEATFYDPYGCDERSSCPTYTVTMEYVNDTEFGFPILIGMFPAGYSPSTGDTLTITALNDTVTLTLRFEDDMFTAEQGELPDGFALQGFYAPNVNELLIAHDYNQPDGDYPVTIMVCSGKEPSKCFDMRVSNAKSAKYQVVDGQGSIAISFEGAYTPAVGDVWTVTYAEDVIEGGDTFTLEVGYVNGTNYASLDNTMNGNEYGCAVVRTYEELIDGHLYSISIEVCGNGRQEESPTS